MDLSLELEASDSGHLIRLKKYFIHNHKKPLRLDVWNPYHRRLLYRFADYYGIQYQTIARTKYKQITYRCGDGWIDGTIRYEWNEIKTITFEPYNRYQKLMNIILGLIRILPIELIRYEIIPYLIYSVAPYRKLIAYDCRIRH